MPSSDESAAAEAADPPSAREAHGERRRLGPAAFVIGSRVLLLCAAGAALVLALQGMRERQHASLESDPVFYLCPMHPEVTSPVAGDCPICGMALEHPSTVEKATAAGDRQSKRIGQVERRIITQTIRAPAFAGRDGVVTAILHRDALVGLVPGERALFFPRTAPAAGCPIRVSTEPSAAWDEATVEARFRMESRIDLPTVGWVQLAARPRDLLVVPESAVLYAGDGAYVLAAADGHTFTRRSVRIGTILDSGHIADLSGDRFGLVVVLSGLKAGERVVVGDTFFADAELRLRVARGQSAEVVE